MRQRAELERHRIDVAVNNVAKMWNFRSEAMVATDDDEPHDTLTTMTRMPQSNDKAADSEYTAKDDTDEAQLLAHLEMHRDTAASAFDTLRRLRSEADNLQHMISTTTATLRDEFSAWYATATADAQQIHIE